MKTVWVYAQAHGGILLLGRAFPLRDQAAYKRRCFEVSGTRYHVFIAFGLDEVDTLARVNHRIAQREAKG